MVLIERLCYNVGVVLADVVYYSVVPTSAVVIGKVTNGGRAVSEFAAKHVLIDKSADAISENLFECLQYID